ncbi:cytochrome P450 [Mycolicibacterium sp. jd]|uniref:cytochrome P450 n=1 Tax=unclassified Mycolicibacterium TaxID=2636767 RepID=UPI00351B557D
MATGRGHTAAPWAQRLAGRHTPSDVPVYRADIYSEAAIRDPYPHYSAMRDLGRVVWLPKQRLYALPRYAEVKSALHDDDIFRSNNGVPLNPISRFIGRNSLLLTDGSAHDRLRKLMAQRLTPRGLRPLHTQVEDLAEQTVLTALAKGRVDGVQDIALKLPLTVVPDLVGWPRAQREHLVEWAGAIFDLLGPLNRQAVRSMPNGVSMLGFVYRLARRRDVLPGSMSAEIIEGIDNGTIKQSRLPSVFIDYLGPSIDTTASAIAAALWLFATNPTQWQMLQADPARIPNVVNEVARLESPVRAFGRRCQRDTEIAGARIPAGSRLLIMYASANRDERIWTDPDRFDIARDASGQLGFGYGTHGCAGQGLARLETQAILRSLVEHVDHIEIDGTPQRALNNIIHRFERLPLRLVTKTAVS